MSDVTFSNKSLPGCIGFGCLFWTAVGIVGAAVVMIPLPEPAKQNVLGGLGVLAAGLYIGELIRRNKQKKWPFNK